MKLHPPYAHISRFPLAEAAMAPVLSVRLDVADVIDCLRGYTDCGTLGGNSARARIMASEVLGINFR